MLRVCGCGPLLSLWWLPARGGNSAGLACGAMKPPRVWVIAPLTAVLVGALVASWQFVWRRQSDDSDCSDTGFAQTCTKHFSCKKFLRRKRLSECRAPNAAAKKCVYFWDRPGQKFNLTKRWAPPPVRRKNATRRPENAAIYQQVPVALILKRDHETASQQQVSCIFQHRPFCRICWIKRLQTSLRFVGFWKGSTSGHLASSFFFSRLSGWCRVSACLPALCL